jgi:hypothetical protein
MLYYCRKAYIYDEDELKNQVGLFRKNWRPNE